MPPDPDPDRTRTAANLLHESIERREPFAPLPRECAPRDLEEAYAIQARLQAMRAPALGPIVGWKIAGAARSRTRMLGVDEPLRGGIHATQVHRDRATLRAADHGHLESLSAHAASLLPRCGVRPGVKARREAIQEFWGKPRLMPA